MQSASAPTPPNTGEKRGARKLARAQATKLRHEEQLLKCKQLLTVPATRIEAANRWDACHHTKPTQYKDRHLLRAAFPELVNAAAAADPKRHIPPLQKAAASQPSPSDLSDRLALARCRGCDQLLVEAGCGSGSAVFPLLRANERLFACAFDFSKRAVELVRASDEYVSDRIFAFQADVADAASYVDRIQMAVPQGADFVTVFWTLSALEPAWMKQAALGLAKLLTVGGWLFVRDYAVGDMREVKFLKGGRRVEGCDEKRLYLRGDGTYAYFFEKGELQDLFEDVGLTCVSCDYEERIVENRRQGIVMRRRWVQAKFRAPWNAQVLGVLDG